MTRLKEIVSVFVLVFVACFTALAVAPHSANLAELTKLASFQATPPASLEELRTGVARLNAQTPSGGRLYGTAFYLGNDLWLTAKHVVMYPNGQAFKLVSVEGEKTSALKPKLVWASGQSDLAIVSAREVLGAHEFKLRCAPPVLGEAVTLMGFPAFDRRDRQALTVRGTVADEQTKTEDWPAEGFKSKIFIANILGHSGVSGGPLIGSDGLVVGVATGVLYFNGAPVTYLSAVALTDLCRVLDTFK